MLVLFAIIGRMAEPKKRQTWGERPPFALANSVGNQST